MSLRAQPHLLLPLLATMACTPGDTQFTVALAPDFAPPRHSVSVLGVYKDGRMSVEAWDPFAEHLASALGPGPCEPAYGELTVSNEALADAIDAYTRDNGPTDDLLAQIAPAAAGDLVLVLVLADKLPQKSAVDAGAPAPPSGAGGSPATAWRTHARRGRPPSAEPPRDTNRLDISALYYSVALRRSVAQVELHYTGTSTDEAMTRFGAKLAEAVPEGHCVGWNWPLGIDPNGIRQSSEQGGASSEGLR